MQNIADWLISGSIGLLFGIVSAWVTYRYQRKRDDIAWAREKLKMQEQFAHEKELLERQLRDQKESQLRGALTRGIDNAEKEIQALERSRILLIGSSGGHLPPVSADDLRELAQKLIDKVSDVRSALFGIETLMPSAKMQAPLAAQDVKRWEIKRSGLMQTLQDAVAASKIIQDIADELEAR